MENWAIVPPPRETARAWDRDDGDATLMEGVKPQSYDFVYASHILEHLPDPITALRSWWRILKPGGYLIVAVPHRDLYEKKTDLPSRWNKDHKHFFLPKNTEAPSTIGLEPLIAATLGEMDLAYLKVCDEGHTITDPELHSDGEYSIEAVVRKPLH